jgi:hypothetical protein
MLSAFPKSVVSIIISLTDASSRYYYGEFFGKCTSRKAATHTWFALTLTPSQSVSCCAFMASVTPPPFVKKQMGYL